MTDETRRKVGQIFNLLLADEFVICVATRDFHWNVTGPDFSSLHQLFEEQSKQLEDWIDQLAERARAIGAWTRGGWPELRKRRSVRLDA
jgi:starvation-inducible DNA-binding protein